MLADPRLVKSPEASRASRESRGRWLFTAAALLLLSFVGGECTPTPAESGAAVLLVAPAVFLFGLFIVWLLRLVWQPLVGPRPFEPMPQIATFFGLLLFSLLGALGNPKGREWAFVALIVFGSSYVSLLLVVWRIWFYKRPQTAFTWAAIATMVVMLLPAPLFVMLEPGRDVADGVIGVLWMLPGVIGYVTTPLLVITFGEIMIRRLLQKKAPDEAS